MIQDGTHRLYQPGKLLAHIDRSFPITSWFVGPVFDPVPDGARHTYATTAVRLLGRGGRDLSDAKGAKSKEFMKDFATDLSYAMEIKAKVFDDFVVVDTQPDSFVLRFKVKGSNKSYELPVQATTLALTLAVALL